MADNAVVGIGAAVAVTALTVVVVGVSQCVRSPIFVSSPSRRGSVVVIAVLSLCGSGLSGVFAHSKDHGL